MSSSQKKHDVYTMSLIAVVLSLIFSLFLMSQNFQNIYSSSTPLGFLTSESNKQLLANITSTYFPSLMIALVMASIMLVFFIYIRISFKNEYPFSAAYSVSFIVIILEILAISTLLILLNLSQLEFSPISILQNTWVAPIIQLVFLMLFGGSFVATLIAIIDYRKHSNL